MSILFADEEIAGDQLALGQAESLDIQMCSEAVAIEVNPSGEVDVFEDGFLYPRAPALP